MFDPQHGDIPASQTQGYPFLPSAALNIPIQVNLMTAAWQEAETVLWHQMHSPVGLDRRGCAPGLSEPCSGPGDSRCPSWQGHLSELSPLDSNPENPSLSMEGGQVWPLVLELEMPLGCSWSGSDGVLICFATPQVYFVYHCSFHGTSLIAVSASLGLYHSITFFTIQHGVDRLKQN